MLSTRLVKNLDAWKATGRRCVGLRFKLPLNRYSLLITPHRRTQRLERILEPQGFWTRMPRIVGESNPPHLNFLRARPTELGLCHDNY